MSESTDTPVVISGAGPSGSILAIALARFGVASVLLERRTRPATIPKAHAVNPRTQEICHSLGIDIDELNRLSEPRSRSGTVQFAPRLRGPLFGSLPYERMDDGALEFTPFPLINLPQPDFENVLHARVTAEPLIDYRRGHEWLSSVDTADGVVSTIRSQDGEYELTGSYLIAADGANSPIREGLGTSMSGVLEVNAAVSIVFTADLRGLTVDRPGVLFWLTDPEVNSTLLCYHADRLWTLTASHPAGTNDTSIYTMEYCAELIRRAMSYDDVDLDFEITRIIPWSVRSEVADEYRSGRTILIGDAAHRFPPTGGLGLNTGVQDAHNLAWKLAAQLQGWGGDALLDSFQVERQPIARQNAEQSLANSRRLAHLADLSCPAEIGSSPERFEAWLNTDGRREKVAAAIEVQREHFDSFALQLGFSYNPDYRTPEDISVFVPSAEVGDRMPHAWITDGAGRRSTLELLDPLTFTLLTFTLLTGPPGDGTGADAPDGVPLTIASIGADAEVDPAWLELMGLADGGSLLVRPDGHIAARLAPGSAAAELSEALRVSAGLTA